MGRRSDALVCGLRLPGSDPTLDTGTRLWDMPITLGNGGISDMPEVKISKSEGL
jgi:hypothetical protein